MPGLPLAFVAHELRGPLASLMISSGVLAADLDVLQPQQVRALVHGIHRSTLWLQGLIENLMVAATIREGRFDVRPQRVDLLDLIDEIRPVVEPLLERRLQPLRISKAKEVPVIQADPRRLGQVLINLMLNASKFSPCGSPIDVSIKTRPGRVVVTVADRGPGIAERHSADLFEPFYRAGVASPRPDGVGLGLAVVKAIVEAHGGHVGAERRRGGGARFRFELPSSQNGFPSGGGDR